MNVKQTFVKQFAGFFLCGTWNKNIDLLYEESLNYALVLAYQASVVKQRFLDLQQFHPGKVSVKLIDSRCISQPIPEQRADSKVWKTQALSSDSLTDRHEKWKSPSLLPRCGSSWSSSCAHAQRGPRGAARASSPSKSQHRLSTARALLHTLNDLKSSRVCFNIFRLFGSIFNRSSGDFKIWSESYTGGFICFCIFIYK